MPNTLGPFADGQQVSVKGRIGSAFGSPIGQEKGKIKVLPASAAGRRSDGSSRSPLSEEGGGSNAGDCLPV